MKLQFPVVGLLSGMLLLSCNSSDKKLNAGQNNSDSTVKIQQSAESTIDTTATKLHKADLKTVELVKHKLSTMFKDDLAKNLIDAQSRKFKLFEYNLNEDPKKEIFVGLTGSYFCGSGGCTLLLLSPEGKLINKFTVVDYPIMIGNTINKGWKDLILPSNGKDHLMKFNGKNYPSNPSTQAVHPMDAKQDLVKGLNPTDESFDW